MEGKVALEVASIQCEYLPGADTMVSVDGWMKGFISKLLHIIPTRSGSTATSLSITKNWEHWKHGSDNTCYARLITSQIWIPHQCQRRAGSYWRLILNSCESG
jgi:hypothetical protein